MISRPRYPLELEVYIARLAHEMRMSEVKHELYFRHHQRLTTLNGLYEDVIALRLYETRVYMENSSVYDYNIMVEQTPQKRPYHLEELTPSLEHYSLLNIVYGWTSCTYYTLYPCFGNGVLFYRLLVFQFIELVPDNDWVHLNEAELRAIKQSHVRLKFILD